MTTRLLLLSLSLGIAVAPTLRAEEAPPEVKTAGFHLKNRSSFAVPAGTRAPFWPIGWTPTSKRTTSIEGTAPVVEVAIKPEQFTVTSILLGSQSLAVINGRTYGEGEYLKTPRTALKDGAAASALPAGARVRVLRITDGSVTLQAGGQSLNVPLKRQQLLERKSSSEDELLSQVGQG